MAFSVARFIQKGGAFINYYMVIQLIAEFYQVVKSWTSQLNFVLLLLKFQYHGGTNFGRTAGGPFIATSYDYDAPLDEYGMQERSICYLPKLSTSVV